jgi:NAD+ diphosphatase
MLQDIHPHTLDNAYRQAVYDSHDHLLCYRDHAVLLKKEGDAYAFVSAGMLELSAEDVVYLFDIDQVNCFAVYDRSKIPQAIPAGCEWVSIHEMRNLQQTEVAWACVVGMHIMQGYWLKSFCGRCGGKTRPKEDERAVVCTSCAAVVYPRISPAVITLVLDGDRLLLVRGKNFHGTFYSLVAGYVDVGETIEEAVSREICEEVGLTVSHITYYKSQPWPFSSSLMIGCFAKAETTDIQIDYSELEDAQWFDRDHLPELSSSVSIAGSMIRDYLEGRVHFDWMDA